MGDVFLRGIFRPKSTATLLRNVCERCHNLLDILGCRILGMGHHMPVYVGGDTRFRVPRPSLHCVYRRTDIQQDRDRSVPQIVEADIREAILAQDMLELPGDLGLVDVGANAGREDHAVFLPAVSGLDLLGLLLLTVRFQHCQAALTQLDLAATGPCLGWNKHRTAPVCLLELPLNLQKAFLPIHIRPHQTEKLAFAQAGGQGQIEKRLIRMTFGRCQEGARLLLGEDVKFLRLHLGALDRIHRVVPEQPFLDCLLESAV